MDMKTSNYSLDIILEITENAPEMVTVYFQVATEEMEGRSRDNIEVVDVLDRDGDLVDFEAHLDDIMKAIKDNRNKWVREYD